MKHVTHHFGGVDLAFEDDLGADLADRDLSAWEDLGNAGLEIGGIDSDADQVRLALVVLVPEGQGGGAERLAEEVEQVGLGGLAIEELDIGHVGVCHQDSTDR